MRWVTRILQLLGLGEHAEFIWQILDWLGLTKPLNWLLYLTGGGAGGYLARIADWPLIVIFLCVIGTGVALAFIYAFLHSRSLILPRTNAKAANAPQAVRGVQLGWWPLRDLFSHLAPHLPLRSHKKTETGAFIDGVDPRWKPIGDMALKPLSQGRLRAVGRQQKGAKRSQSGPIPADFWREAKFTYWFLDAGPSTVQDASNGHDFYSEIEVDRSESMEIWPNGAEISLLEAARQIWEGIKDTPMGVAIFGLNDGPDDILTWICREIAMYQNGKEPLVTLRGNQPPARPPEPIYTAPLTNYDFIIEGNAIILQSRYGNSRYENLTVVAAEADRAIRDLASRNIR